MGAGLHQAGEASQLASWGRGLDHQTEEEEVEEAAAAAAAARDEQAAIAMAIAAGAAERWERENNGQVTTAG